MTSKERVLSALNHKQPDKVPVDFGGCTCSCMHVTCVEALREYYGLEKHPVYTYIYLSTMTGVIEPDLQEAIGVDLDGINGYACSFGFPYEDWKEWDYFGHKVLVPGKFEVDPDGNGGWLIYPQGDRTAEPSGHMPANGYYFDNIMRQKEEVDEDNLDYHDNIEEYGPVSDEQLKFFADRAAALAGNGRAVTRRSAAWAWATRLRCRVPACCTRRASARWRTGTWRRCSTRIMCMRSLRRRPISRSRIWRSTGRLWAIRSTWRSSAARTSARSVRSSARWTNSASSICRIIRRSTTGSTAHQLEDAQAQLRRG